jgi:hypothetical protein
VIKGIFIKRFSPVFCGITTLSQLKAAHIFDIFRRAAVIPEKDSKFLQKYEIPDLYDTSNGITLYAECYDCFDALLCCVSCVEKEGEGGFRYTIRVVNASYNSSCTQTLVTCGAFSVSKIKI